MESRGEAILSCLFGVSLKYNKKYCYPSQGTLQRLLFDFHSVDISNRTLNRDLATLVNERYIERVRRTKKGDGGKRVFTSTLYKFKIKAYIWLNSLGRWVKKVFSSFRLPKMADYKSISGNEISPNAGAPCGNPVESVIKGKPSPLPLQG